VNWKTVVRVGVFVCFALSAAALALIIVKSKDFAQQYIQLKQENTELRARITELGRVDIAHETGIGMLEDRASDTETRLDGAEARIDLLDTSMHPDKKRHQRLLHTRDAILDHLHGGKSIKPCGDLTPWEVYRIAGWYVDYTDRYGVDLSLALAVGRRESAFCQKAVSRAGAVGIMQIMPRTADDLAQRIGMRLSRHKTQDNIRMGVYYLGQLMLDFKGDTELAIKAYNTGPHNVKKVIAGELTGYFTETKVYWDFVRYYQQDFEEAGL